MNAPLCVNCVYYAPGAHPRYPGEFSRCMYPRPEANARSFVTGEIIDRTSKETRWCEVERDPSNFRGTCTSKGRRFLGHDGSTAPEPARRWWQWWRA